MGQVASRAETPAAAKHLDHLPPRCRCTWHHMLDKHEFIAWIAPDCRGLELKPWVGIKMPHTGGTVPPHAGDGDC
jgi:hypothetical protein